MWWMLWKNPMSAAAGYIAMAVPTAIILFALVMAVIVGWRNWFGLGTKDIPPDDDDEGRRPN